MTSAIARPLPFPPLPSLPPPLPLLAGGGVPPVALPVAEVDDDELGDGELDAFPPEEAGLEVVALGEGEAALPELSLGVLEALALLSIGLAVLSELVELLADVELPVGEPFPRRRERLFLALLCAGVVAFGVVGGVLDSVASEGDAALSVVLGTP